MGTERYWELHEKGLGEGLTAEETKEWRALNFEHLKELFPFLMKDEAENETNVAKNTTGENDE